ncbi:MULTISPECIES: 2-isopropylmalate synthase [unclassified Fusibacter]|uniref:2-isopropylmalate synthase n=1 Tax=unclassified Fusibacter TaxID=2624464 RepID=UPI001011A0E5|nr:MULTISPECIES: 2-isopropylmalate synthase [unclassified Fusibacter]MCK8059183.1 2-isopropylmalate synthase [Fusibacter sp. A2]NPE22592.1 2-isopropylmalate synthase [Fusibacter sp. A1]RXV60693.1 2-isopropylmalate synthase [Fusibacter sp. A1]
MNGRVIIFDTTLRDGEQSPGNTMDLNEKVLMAKQLESLGVDVIEAGFPAASEGDFNAVETIAKTLKKTIVCGLCRALESDISRTWEAVKHAEKPRIHTFIATSEIHMRDKLKMTKEEVKHRAVAMVRYAKSLCEDIEFSAEDASRSDLSFLAEVIEGVIGAGATTVNIPDTVGYSTPGEIAKIFTYLKKHVKSIDQAVLSTHCHNDLGMAVSNTLSAIENGARQIECTINGIGERAGNAALEEVVMALETRRDLLGLDTSIVTQMLLKTSKLLSSITGNPVATNKAIVGKNAFAHESGIHQHGMLSNSETYEIMTPESVGHRSNQLVLGKHSGKHSFVKFIKELGYELSDEKITEAFTTFKSLADRKKDIDQRDILAIITDEAVKEKQLYKLKSFSIHTGTHNGSMATIRLEGDSGDYEEAAIGDGPIDASYNAIKKIVDIDATLISYQIKAVTEGMDAQGESTVELKFDNKCYRGHGLSTDVIKSSIEAYIHAINRIVVRQV